MDAGKPSQDPPGTTRGVAGRQRRRHQRACRTCRRSTGERALKPSKPSARQPEHCSPRGILPRSSPPLPPALATRPRPVRPPVTHPSLPCHPPRRGCSRESGPTPAVPPRMLHQLRRPRDARPPSTDAKARSPCANHFCPRHFVPTDARRGHTRRAAPWSPPMARLPTAASAGECSKRTAAAATADPTPAKTPGASGSPA